MTSTPLDCKSNTVFLASSLLPNTIIFLPGITPNLLRNVLTALAIIIPGRSLFLKTIGLSIDPEHKTVFFETIRQNILSGR